MHALAGKFIHLIADQMGSDQKVLRRALSMQELVLEHTPELTDEYQEALVEASQLHIEGADFCKGIDLLKKLGEVRNRRGQGTGYRQVLHTLPERSVQQFTLASHSCDSELSLELFGYLMDMGMMQPEKPEECIKCWKVYGLVLKEFAGKEEWETYFEKTLRPHVVWAHSEQLPSKYNKVSSLWRDMT
jgi:hypothetical protein